MNGEIFILHGHKKTDVYLKTLDAIKNHILATYTQLDDILVALEEQKEFDFTTIKPNRPVHPETTKEYKAATDDEKRDLMLAYDDEKDDFQDARKEFNKRVA